MEMKHIPKRPHRKSREKYFFVATVFLGLFFFVASRHSSFSVTTPETNVFPESKEPVEEIIQAPYVQIDSTKIPVEIMKDSASIKKGLSGRMSLEENRGMFFVFQKSDRYRFWMPDMHFPIDIVWIQDNEIKEIHENVSPVFDPSNPKFYTSPVPVQYVLEVNAGFMSRHLMRVGDKISFHFE